MKLTKEQKLALPKKASNRAQYSAYLLMGAAYEAMEEAVEVQFFPRGEFIHRRLRHDFIYVTYRLHDSNPFRVGDDGRVFLVFKHHVIRRDADDQPVALFARTRKQIEMPYVEGILQQGGAFGRQKDRRCRAAQPRKTSFA